MGVWVLALSTTSRRLVTTAHAWSLTKEVRSLRTATNYPFWMASRGGSVGKTLFGSENDNNYYSNDNDNDNDNNENNGSNGDNDDIKRKIPATGWNHNQPEEASRFWVAPNGDTSQQQQKRQASSNKNPSSKTTARTGWLHNTKPKQEQDIGSSEASATTATTNKAQLRLQQAMKQQEQNHRIIEPPTFHACGNDRQIVVTEHRLSVPIYRNGKPSNQQQLKSRMDVAFSIVEEISDDDHESYKWFQSLQTLSPSQRAQAYVQHAALTSADDMLIYLQGGPGFGSPTPVAGFSLSKDGSWGGRALSKYNRIVLMDQRGTGKSTPITKQTLERRFPDLFVLDDDKHTSLEELAIARPDDYKKFHEALELATNYMAQFRADNIVQDAEAIKDALMLPGEPGEVSTLMFLWEL